MVLPNNARALLRMVLRTDRNKYSSEELAVFSELETHIHDIEKVQAQLDRITLTAKAVSNYSKSEMSAEAMTGYAAKVSAFIFRMGMTNVLKAGFELVQSNHGPVRPGWAVFPSIRRSD